jgi:rubrerythrin
MRMPVFILMIGLLSPGLALAQPATDKPIGSTDKNLKAAVAGETYEYTEMYPGFARTAREEGFSDVGEWLETLARAEKSHAGRFAQGLESLT